MSGPLAMASPSSSSVPTCQDVASQTDLFASELEGLKQAMSDDSDLFDLPQGAEDDFGDFVGQTNVMDFFAQEEEKFLQENPFLEEEACETRGNSSVFSGVTDKSIVLRNSGLWAGDTSNVDLAQLRKEEEVRLSRCEYFRHYSSRLGSLENDLAPGQRPEFGFVHRIRSPERKPLSLLPDQAEDRRESEIDLEAKVKESQVVALQESLELRERERRLEEARHTLELEVAAQGQGFGQLVVRVRAAEARNLECEETIRRLEEAREDAEARVRSVGAALHNDTSRPGTPSRYPNILFSIC